MITKMGKDPFWYALAGGEDYELLFTVRPEDVECAKNIIFKETGTMIHEIGEICHVGDGLMIVDEMGYAEPIFPCGFDHFLSKKIDSP